MRVDALADLRVGPVAAGIGDVDHHLAGTRHGIGHVGQHELVGTAFVMDDDCLHRMLPSTGLARPLLGTGVPDA